MQNESFFKQLATAVQLKKEEDGEAFEAFILDARLCQELTIEQLDKLAALDPWFKTDDNFIGAYFQKAHNDLLAKEN